MTKAPIGWALSSSQPQGKAYSVKVDSIDKLQGKYCVSIEKIGTGSTAGFASFIIPRRYAGKEIELRGFMKTQKIENGFAGLWLRLDSRDRMVSFDNMQKINIKGTTEWTEYRITLPYTNEISSITFGGILVGDGKLWIDNLSLYIDGQNITKIKSIPINKAESDTSFFSGSRISKISLTRQQINNLYITGQYWGFLKYHHEQVIAGNYNWDSELFRFLPRVLKAKNNKELSFVLESFLDQLGAPQSSKNGEDDAHAIEVLKPDYGELLTGKILGPSLTNKLIFLRDNTVITENYWIGVEPAGHPKFKNERPYVNMVYPDAGYRLLSLYRYWSMINYYFPYRNLIISDWNTVLKEFNPQFFNALDEKEYLKTALKLIAKVNDTHANIYSWTPSFISIKGKFASPIRNS